MVASGYFGYLDYHKQQTKETLKQPRATQGQPNKTDGDPYNQNNKKQLQ
jgi:hypothetical protein